MNIKNVGVDIEDVNRFKLDYKKNINFFKRVFTKKELDYCFSKPKPEQHLAARFAAKEAIIKIMGSDIFFGDIEILNKKDVPYVKLKNNKNKILLSLSHCNDKAIAFAVLK